eukprot:CAMPEP_0167780886 /NCGR_PEP_ID=MMETSP0111_2-20121227/5616_1 /TAXON_ID=91324 /ORGANISM="Lotharella globosa, Strain CCCM811" /LENGTH=274 /DNA_ID=CAMNT_0007671467 /DNA_START=35 /DNA_END=856 /DNA_ORIENTATION=+
MAQWTPPGFCDALWHFSKVQWYFFVTYFFGNWWTNVKPSTKFYHKVLVIGDSVAAGFGDYVTCLAPYGIINKTPRCHGFEGTHRKTGLGIRERRSLRVDQRRLAPGVQVVLQHCPINGMLLGFLDSLLFRRRPLWRETLDNPRYKDAEIVIVCVGLEDSRHGAEPKKPVRTRDNVRAICTALRSRGKEVILCTIPLRWRLQDEKKNNVFAKDKERNELLAGVVASAGDPQLTLGCDLGSPEFCRQGLYTADAIHFCSEGYRKFAGAFKETLVPA